MRVLPWVIVPLLLLTSCGGYDPDMSKIEGDLAAEIEQQEDVDNLTVDCPSTVEWKPGGEFHCAADGMFIIEPARVTVSMENDQGEYTWTLDD